MMIDRQIVRTLAGAPEKSQETTFGAPEVITLALTVGFVVIGGGLLLLMLTII